MTRFVAPYLDSPTEGLWVNGSYLVPPLIMPSALNIFPDFITAKTSGEVYNVWSIDFERFTALFTSYPAYFIAATRASTSLENLDM